MKKEFINNELWILTIGAGFQRSNVYPPDFPEDEKKPFKSDLRQQIESISIDYKERKISERQHIANIKKIVSNSILNHQVNMNFGIAQKLLNLHLKYQWCLGKLTVEPPHFPVDRLIQEMLNKEAKKININSRVVVPWTTFEDETPYFRSVSIRREGEES